MQTKYSLGIDPGWRNAGIALVREDENGITLVHSATLNPAALGGHVKAAKHVRGLVFDTLRREKVDLESVALDVTIERYVSYNNVNTAEAENILMLIGALAYAFSPGSVSFSRAIDWKTELVKLLVKNRGFDNPSTSLDKKFSIAAAHACLDVKGEFSNDHEADAVCLASVGLLKNRYTARPKAA